MYGLLEKKSEIRLAILLCLCEEDVGGGITKYKKSLLKALEEDIP